MNNNLTRGMIKQVIMRNLLDSTYIACMSDLYEEYMQNKNSVLNTFVFVFFCNQTGLFN